MGFIGKHFSRKWNLKYKIREVPLNTIIDSLNINFEETQIIWNIS